jgi:K+-sensing histidine kinase KdpD
MSLILVNHRISKQWLLHRSGSASNDIFCTTLILIFLSTSARSAHQGRAWRGSVGRPFFSRITAVMCPIMADEPPSERKDSQSIPWSDAIRFIRQLSHDLRNDLNAIELQSAYISELEKNGELKNEIKRLRGMISGLASTLQRLSRAVGEVRPDLIPYHATDFMQDLREKIDRDFPKESREISWDIQLGDAMLNVDPQFFEEAFIELFANAFRHDRGKGPLAARARIESNRFLFTLHEPKVRFDLPTEDWGREPLRKMSQRHYGLGLNRVRAIVEAHRGELNAQYDPKVSTLITTLRLPLSGEASEEA